MAIIIIPVFLGFLLDIWLGDNQRMFHLIRVIGFLITWMEESIGRKISRIFHKKSIGELIGGSITSIGVLLIFNSVLGLILYIGYRIHPLIYYGLATFISYQMLAMKDLKVESMLVYQSLYQKDLTKARWALSRIVGRDTDILTEQEVCKAAVETVAENASDGVIAPMFYMLLAGPIGGSIYKTINTMDSMLGYRNEKYEYFGKLAARLDDVANFIPARLSGLYMLLSGGLQGYSWKNGLYILRRDRHLHHSPNAGVCEAAMAGLLQIQLAGDTIYQGVVKKKPYIGDDDKKIDKEDIVHSNRILYGMGIISIICGILIHGIIYYMRIRM